MPRAVAVIIACSVIVSAAITYGFAFYAPERLVFWVGFFSVLSEIFRFNSKCMMEAYVRTAYADRIRILEKVRKTRRDVEC